MKILFVVRTMNIGGIESFVKNVIEKIYEKYECECLICDEGHSDYEDSLSNIIKIRKISSPCGFKVNFYRELDEFFKINKNYDIVYVHMAFSNGIVGLAAKRNKIQRIFYHSHGVALIRDVSVTEKIYQYFMKIIMNKTGDEFIACSDLAGKYLFEQKFVEKGVVLKNGIDVKNCVFDEIKRNRIRKNYNIEKESIVIGNIGSLSENKNQELIIRILSELSNENDNLRVLLVGGGSYKENLQQLAAKKNVIEKVIFAGKTNDVSAYLSAMDIFVFPSKSEGFGIALLEAQANGLPCVVSDSIQPEAKINIDKIVTVSLSDDISKWVQAIKEAQKMQRDDDGINKVVDAGYSLDNTAEKLCELIYKGGN